MVALLYMIGQIMLIQMVRQITSKKMKVIIYLLVIIDLQLQEAMILLERLGE